MSLPDFLIRNSLNMTSAIQWYVDAPGDRSIASPVFVLQGRKIFLYFSRSETLFKLSLHDERYCAEQLRPFSVLVFAHLVNENVNRFKVFERCINTLPVNPLWSYDPSKDGSSDIKFKLMEFAFLFDKNSGLTFQEPEVKTKYGIAEDASSLLQNNLKNLSVDLSKMLETSAYADVQIHCNGGVVHAHRAILASRSKVFDRMFQADMQESKTGVIKMVDAEIAAVKVFLQFIYGGEIGNPSEDILHCLYRLADKYDVANLKNLSSYLMTEHVCKKSRE